MLLRLLSFLISKNGLIGLLVMGLVYCAMMWHRTTVEFKTAQLVYQNPAVKTTERVVYKEGPVRIKKVIVWQKGGGKVTTVEEEHDVSTTTTESGTESAPVPLNVAVPRPDRWLVGVGNRNLSFRTWDNYSLWAGRRIGRVSALGGVGYRSGVEGQLLLTVEVGN